LLHKRSRRKIIERNWVELDNKDSNPRQTLSRLRDRCREAISDLTLLANKLPEDTQDEIFSRKRIEPLIIEVLKFTSFLENKRDWYHKEWHDKPNSFLPLTHSFKPSITKLDKRRIRLCSMLVERCIQFCISQYDILEQNTPNLTKPIRDHLRQSIELCNDIANKVELTDLQNLNNKKNLIYLFRWERATKKDRQKFEKFLIDETISYANIILQPEQIEMSRDGRTLTCVLELGDHPIISVRMNKGITNKIVEVIFRELKRKRNFKTMNLSIKQEDDITYVFKSA
jgi:hypothetical protein